MSNIKDRYSTEMYELEETLNDFVQCNLEIYCDINEIDKGIKYFKDNYISQDEEVKEYVLLEVLDNYSLIDEWVKEYESKKSKIAFRKSLRKRYASLKK